MKNTRFMERLFSATEERDEELTSQVAQDIEDAKANGEVDTEEINYKANGDGTVSITDKENGEVTVAEQGEDGMYDLYPDKGWRTESAHASTRLRMARHRNPRLPRRGLHLCGSA